MRAGRNVQPLSYDVRLPDEAQADALRLLDASRAVVNALLARLWPRLDEFMGERSGPAWKQVGVMMGSPDQHGDRQFRCESETAGRIMRAQAERKQVFALIQPILTEGFIRPKEGKRPAGKHRKQIKEAIEALQKTLQDDETAFVTLQNVVEQACNHFLIHGTFPACYEEMQAIPLLNVGMLTYAGDDGGDKGQSYRLSFDLPDGTACLRFRFPDAAGWWQWKQDPIVLPLPACVVERLKAGLPMAPTLRELIKPDGSRVAVLDVIVQVKQAELPDWTQVERVLGFDWGVNTLITAAVLEHAPSDPEHPLQVSRPLFLNTGGLDGHQARTRRQIDELKAARDKLAEEDPRRALYEEEIRRCWRLYEARNREVAHLAANLLLLFAQVWGCSLICGESLATLKTTGRGRGVRGRWRNYRNNTTIRADIWRILRYKCHVLGMRFRSERPRGTSHTCPHCGKPAHTYRSPRREHRVAPVKWGRWLWCAHCGYNADRDYCAALNIARLGIAFLTCMQTTGQGKAFSVTAIEAVKPCPYMAHGAVLLFPPQTDLHRLLERGKLYINGWKKSVTLRSSYATPLLLRLCS
ncbi:MAG TPA: zinc ribbon domain-containing protein [Ktedonobacteraceae bacterium]|nr:zinc ribbon domain-containing protein [Ktedonobacteraceae bacterium]